ncbi:MAG: CAP domain-containing protein [Acidimicrobiia bacterium]
MRTVRKISIVLVALVVMTIGLVAPAQAGTEGSFLSKINSSRASAGLPPLTMSSELVPDARAHSAEMMAAGNIYHSSNLAGVASGWESLAENVGAGPSVSSLHTAFMNSAGHRRNILGNFNYAGVGVKEADGQIWVTVIFMRKGSAPATTTTTTSTTTTTAAPEPTTTTTTAPPAETTATTAAPTPPATEPPAQAVPATKPVRVTGTTGRASSTTSGAAVAASKGKEPPHIQALHLPLAD